MDLTVQLLDTTGTLLLDLNEGGYKAKALPDDLRVWRGERSESPWVDGDAPSGPETLAVVAKPLEVRIRGNTWAQVEQRYQALLDAVDRPRFLLAIGAEGVTRVWRVTQRPSTSSPVPPEAVVNRTRVVTVQVTAQPMPTLTGV